ncbi:DHH phosphoesterase [Cristinia sonorae]|uniref:DHH phosphoesterase n=1 Tax=Cristinia sonorae TaxID=1940300 RepID=A0A8K0UN94_9AGAR|nr:DHH phosphoesterase [Cristinia sonorae]
MKSPNKRARSPSPADHPAIWPASDHHLQAARAFLKQSATANQPVLLLPDKDADGLCASLIIYRTLLLLGLSPSLISVHFVAKGSNVHALAERRRMEAYEPKWVIVVDQGSREGGPLVNGKDVKTLVVDHHWSDAFPSGALALSAARYPPVATSSTLAYILCRPLHEDVRLQTDYLCAIGTMGDLGSAFKWEDPWPVEDMKACFKKYTKKCLSDAVRLVNAPRRTATYDVSSAWEALLRTDTPRAITDTPTSSTPACIRRLYAAQAEVKAETDKWSHAPPKFSGDGRVALIRITSGAQIHPLIATRWAQTLKSSKLEIVMCANDGYVPSSPSTTTNFSCRVARCAASRSTMSVPVDIISTLKEYASRVPGLREAMGEDFARGHKEASGGIVRTEEFERLWGVMLESEGEGDGGGGRGSPKKKQKRDVSAQKNTLEGWVVRDPT